MELMIKKMKINVIFSNITIYFIKNIFFQAKNNIVINKISINNNLQLKIIYSLFIKNEI